MTDSITFPVLHVTDETKATKSSYRRRARQDVPFFSRLLRDDEQGGE
jgi:hypothetical protein